MISNRNSYLITVKRIKSDRTKAHLPCPFCKKIFITKEDQQPAGTFDQMRKHVTRAHNDERDAVIVKRQAAKLWRLYKGTGIE